MLLWPKWLNMANPPFESPLTVVAEQHQRRIRLMLLICAGLLVVQGIAWALFFTSRAEWHLVAVDMVMLFAGVTVGGLTHLKRMRAAFFLMATTMLVLICGLSLLFDVPSAQAPRSIHQYLLVMAAASLLFLRHERLPLRLGVTAVFFAAFVALASSNFAIDAGYALPDSVRVPGTWVNNVFSALALYAVIHIILSEVADQSVMEIDLRKGIARGEFFLVYQPQVNSQATVLGAEALLRWQHPSLGLVRPDEFIPMAEKTGLILPLGSWVLGKACSQLVDWSACPDMAGLTLSVNVSVQQLRQPDFVQQVQSVLERTKAPPHLLKLELTESSLVQDMEDIIVKMKTLKSMGVGFSLDDFGTGYSSLNYLKRLPLDQLKIDQSFVRDVLTDDHDASIARMVIALGKNLGFDVIAEGVESQAQCDFLIQNDCHLFQGYLFSKPVTGDQYMDYVAKQKASVELQGTSDPLLAP
jgi:EAL domain-containing protein (putative c-di-GMP-specific phosphodiesterase class I)